MCGIAGFIGPAPNADALLAAMGAALRHRGPDSAGTWHDAESGAGLAHRRLAIVDLSESGAQPMVSSCGRFVLSYNGEIYNHKELRQDIDASTPTEWRGTSDTEVLLAAIVQWGLRETLRRCNGMFALALWDRHRKEMHLARDRMGEKPLYVGWVGGSIVFASELRSLRCHPAWRHSVSAPAVGALLQLGYVPAPLSIHEHTFKLPAASVICLRPSDCLKVPDADAFLATVERYWELDGVAEQSAENPIDCSEIQAVDALDALLDDAVRARMQADVPLGALLSGGVDSTLIVASMQRQSAAPVRTFTVGFEDQRFDETSAARHTARLIGTRHEEMLLDARHALDIVATLPDVYDEPFADMAQIPALLVSEATRRHVTVALTGDGGDELFHGYQRYLDATRNWRVLRHLAPGVRRRAGAAMRGLGGIVGPAGLSSRLHRQGRRVAAKNRDDYYLRLLTFDEAPASPGVRWPTIPTRLADLPPRMRFLDQSLGLPEGINTKTDRASMRFALELRPPFLDHRIVEFSWRLPQQLLARGTIGKYLLRRLLERHFPDGAFQLGKKHGFDVPVAKWLRGPLRDWATALMAQHVLDRTPHLDVDHAHRLMSQHQSGSADHGHALWAILMYLAWNERHA